MSGEIDTTDRIASDLERVEEELRNNTNVNTATSSSGGGGGRAAFESVASALTSLRRRIARSTNRSNNSGNASATTDSTTTTTTTVAAPAAAASTTTTTDASLMQRLESAELAHSNRIPLGLLQQEMARRSQPASTSSSSSVAEVVRRKSGDPAAAGASSSSSAPRVGQLKDGEVGAEEGGNGNDNDGEERDVLLTPPPHQPSMEGGDAAGGLLSSAGRRRRASTLMASRSRDEALQRPAMDRELHSMGGIEISLQLPPVSEGANETSTELSVVSTKTADEEGAALKLPPRQENEQLQEEDPMKPMDVDDDDTNDLSEDTGDNVTLLLPEKSRSRLNHSSSVILLKSMSSSNNIAGLGSTTNILVPDATTAAAPVPTSDTVVYSWGTEGCHSLHDTDTVRPSDTAASAQVATGGRIARHTVMQVSVGPRHSAVVTTTGQLLVCGQNDVGQVDPMRQREGETVIVKPSLFEFPSAMTRITQVSCGRAHTAAVTAGGTVLTWGDNTVGQLGHKRPSAYAIPTAMVGVKRAAQVSCGHDFTTVLTSRMQLFLCGTQDVVTWKSAVGPPKDDQKEQLEPPLPATVPSLEGLPLVKVVAGARHVVVLTASGTAFCWGSNEQGCCSRAFPKSIHTPVPVIFALDNMETDDKSKTDSADVVVLGDETAEEEDKALSHPFPHWSRESPDEPLALEPAVAIQDVACGEAFTLLLNKLGQVYVCGSNGQGQLGVSEPSVLTATLLETPAAATKFVSIAAGQCHAILLDDNGDVWAMGCNQALAPQLKDKRVQAIAAGGNETVAVAIAPTASLERSASAMEREFSLQKSDDEMSHDDATGSRNSKTGGIIVGGGDDALFVVEKLMAQSDKGRLMKRIHEFFSSPTVWNSLFLDPSECDDLYQQLLSGDDIETTVAIAKAMEQAMQQGLESLRSSSARLLYPESVRFLLLFLQCPLFVTSLIVDEDEEEEEEKDKMEEEEENKEGDEQKEKEKKKKELYEFDQRGELSLSLCETFFSLPFEGYKAILQWAAAYGPKYFAKYLVRPLIALLERGLADGAGAKSRAIPSIVSLLRWWHNLSQRHPSLAKPSDFYSDAIGDMDPEDLYADLKRWKDGGKKSGTFFLSANHFLLSPQTKRTILMIENQVEMLRAATSNLTWDREQHQFVFDPFFVLAIDRHNLLPQTLQKISAASHVELRKSLKIVFKGEDAVDAGGVTKEFFHLLSHQLFDGSTGMWSSHTDDNITWFNGDCTWNEDGYYLTGVLVGLAVYNDVILDVNFPRAVYRKLLGYTLGLEDMVDEATKKGLQDLLDYEGDDVEDIFCLSFEQTWMDLGMQRRVELKEGGADISVTSQNKEEYVMLYVKWLLVDSVAKQYDAFERGVMQVLESSSLDLLEPQELELLLVGTPDLDIDAWENKTTYEGFETDSPVIVNFWKFVRNSNRETLLKLLKFTTGTSRAPIGGLGAMPFKIQRAGTDSLQLPTSHTCFNILILPDYGDSYEKLERLLGRAILECEGFGLQ